MADLAFAQYVDFARRVPIPVDLTNVDSTFDEYVRGAYKWASEVYEDGDRIYIYGMILSPCRLRSSILSIIPQDSLAAHIKRGHLRL